MSTDGYLPAGLVIALEEALDDYSDHQAWRCGHPNRYKLDKDCACGLHEWRRGAMKVLGQVPCATCHGSGTRPTVDPSDGWMTCPDCVGTGRNPGDLQDKPAPETTQKDNA